MSLLRLTATIDLRSDQSLIYSMNINNLELLKNIKVVVHGEVFVGLYLWPAVRTFTISTSAIISKKSLAGEKSEKKVWRVFYIYFLNDILWLQALPVISILDRK